MDGDRIEDGLFEDWEEEEARGVLVQFLDTVDVTSPEFEARMTTFGLQVESTYPGLSVAHILGTWDSLERLSLEPDLVRIERNPVFTLALDSSLMSARLDDMAKAYLATNYPGIETDGDGVRIAILDSGYDGLHPFLDDQDDNPLTDDPKLLEYYNYVDNPTFPLICVDLGCLGNANVTDVNGHGTHVASTAAGTGNGTEFKGVAPQARIVAIKIANDDGTIDGSTLLKGLNVILTAVTGGEDFATRYVHIVSLSLGHQLPRQVADGSDIISQASADIVGRGVVVIAAMGNENLQDPNIVNAPAIHPDVIAVAAVDDGWNIADFSTRGFYSEGTLKPDISAPGVDIIAAAPGGGIVSLGGTSMATPHVAGAAALVLQNNQAFTPADVRLQLIGSAIPRGGGPNSFYGWGILDGIAALTGIPTQPPITVQSDSTIELSPFFPPYAVDQENLTINGTIRSGFYGLPFVDLTVKWDNVTIGNVTTDGLGNFSMVYPIDDGMPMTHELRIEYAGDAFVDPSNLTTDVLVKRRVTIAADIPDWVFTGTPLEVAGYILDNVTGVENLTVQYLIPDIFGDTPYDSNVTDEDGYFYTDSYTVPLGEQVGMIYDVQVVFLGDDHYVDYFVNKNVDVRHRTTLVVNPDVVHRGETVVVTGDIQTEAGPFLLPRINGVNYTYTVAIRWEGGASIGTADVHDDGTFTGNAGIPSNAILGNHTLTVYFADNRWYGNGTATTTYTVKYYAWPDIIIPVNITAGHSMDIVGTIVANETGGPVPGFYEIEGFMDNQRFGYYTADGVGDFLLNYTVPNATPAAVHNLMVRLTPDIDNYTFYEPNQFDFPIDVIRETRFNMGGDVPERIARNSTIPIQGALKDAVSGATLKREIDTLPFTYLAEISWRGQTLSVEETESTKGTFSLDWLIPKDEPLGPVRLRYRFQGSRFYTPAYLNLTVTVVSSTSIDMQPQFVQRDSDIVIRGQLLDDHGVGISNHTLNVMWNGSYVNTTLTDPSGFFAVPYHIMWNESLGQIPVTVEFNDTLTYNGVVHDSLFLVRSITQMELNISQPVKGEPMTIKGRLLDDLGVPLNRSLVYLYWITDHENDVHWVGSSTLTEDEDPFIDLVTNNDGEFEYTVDTPIVVPLGPNDIRANYTGLYVDPTTRNLPLHEPVINESEVLVFTRTKLRLMDRQIIKGTQGRPDQTIYPTFADRNDNSEYDELIDIVWQDLNSDNIIDDDELIGNDAVKGYSEVELGVIRERTFNMKGILWEYYNEKSGEQRIRDAKVWINFSGRERNKDTNALGEYTFDLTVPNLPLEEVTFTIYYPGNEERYYYGYETNHTVLVMADSELTADLPLLMLLDESYYITLTLRDNTGNPLFNHTVYGSFGDVDDYGGRADFLTPYVTDLNGSHRFIAGLERTSHGRVLYSFKFNGNTTIFGSSFPSIGAPPAPQSVQSAFITYQAPLSKLLVHFAPHMGAIFAAILGAYYAYKYYQKINDVNAMQRILKRTQRKLVAGNEYVATIFKTYQQLLRTLRKHDYIKRESHTFREFEDALRESIPIKGKGLTNLLTVIEEARYSVHRIGEKQRAVAVESFSRVEKQLTRYLTSDEYRNLKAQEKADAEARVDYVNMSMASFGLAMALAAVAGFILLIAFFYTPWWTITYEGDGFTSAYEFTSFGINADTPDIGERSFSYTSPAMLPFAKFESVLFMAGMAAAVGMALSFLGTLFYKNRSQASKFFGFLVAAMAIIPLALIPLMLPGAIGHMITEGGADEIGAPDLDGVDGVIGSYSTVDERTQVESTIFWGPGISFYMSIVAAALSVVAAFNAMRAAFVDKENMRRKGEEFEKLDKTPDLMPMIRQMDKEIVTEGEEAMKAASGGKKKKSGPKRPSGPVKPGSLRKPESGTAVPTARPKK